MLIVVEQPCYVPILTIRDVPNLTQDVPNLTG